MLFLNRKCDRCPLVGRTFPRQSVSRCGVTKSNKKGLSYNCRFILFDTRTFIKRDRFQTQFETDVTFLILGLDKRLDQISQKDLFYVHLMPPQGGIKEMHILKLFKITKQMTCWCVTQLHQTNKNNFHPKHYHAVIALFWVQTVHYVHYTQQIVNRVILSKVQKWEVLQYFKTGELKGTNGTEPMGLLGEEVGLEKHTNHPPPKKKNLINIFKLIKVK